MHSWVQQELKLAGGVAEPSADMQQVLSVRRGTTVPAWQAFLTLHKVGADSWLAQGSHTPGSVQVSTHGMERRACRTQHVLDVLSRSSGRRRTSEASNSWGRA